MSRYAEIRKPPKRFTYNERDALLKITGELKKGFRDHVILCLAFGTGMREHEILALNVGQVYSMPERSRLRLVLTEFKGCEKDPTPQEVVLPPDARRKLNKFYSWKRSMNESLEPDAPLFLSRLKKRLSTRQLRDRIRMWQEKAGFERILGFHATRHTACDDVYGRTKDVRVVQRFARHKRIESTMIYTEPSDEQMLRAIVDQTC